MDSVFEELVKCIKEINSGLIPARDLPAEQNSVGSMWKIYPKDNLLARDGVFGNYWVIIKNTSDSSSDYQFYTGDNVKWRYNRFPQMIFVIDNNGFKGVLTGNTIINLVSFGEKTLDSWYIPVTTSTPGAYIMAGNQLLSVPSGVKMHHVNHRTGMVTEIPNPISPMKMVTHRLVPNPTLHQTRPVDIMSAINHPGVTLGDIGKNLHLLRFG